MSVFPAALFRIVFSTRIIVISVIAMLLQQALATMAPLAMSVIGPVGAIVGATGSYAAGFLFSALATMPISILLLRKSNL